jgi:hypothetical protein
MATEATWLLGRLFDPNELGFRRRRRGIFFVHDAIKDMEPDSRERLYDAAYALERWGLAGFKEQDDPHTELFVWPTPRGRDLVRSLRDHWIAQYEMIMPETGWPARVRAMNATHNTPALIASIVASAGLVVSVAGLLLR